jgi:hypothetical protein
MIQQVGSALGIAVVGVIFFGVIGVDFSPATLREAFLGGMWVPITALLLSIVAAMFLPSVAAVKRHKEEAESAEPEVDSILI